jgi:hypothetical protein
MHASPITFLGSLVPLSQLIRSDASPTALAPLSTLAHTILHPPPAVQL